MSRMEIDSVADADVNDKMEVDINPVVDLNENNEDLDEDIAEQGSGSECSFLKLPSEIMVKIFNHLPQKDIIQARKCSSEMRSFVDKYLDFYAIIHDEKTDLSRIYQLRIKDCLITRYLKDCEIFQFPQVLRRLRFWGPITGHNFRRILRVAVDNEEMSFTRFALGQDYLFLEHEILPGFGKLKTLELLGYTCRDADGCGSIETVSNNANNILSYKMPFIKKLVINFNSYKEELDGISEHFFKFLASHKSIENLNASLIPIIEDRRDEELRQIRNNRQSIVLRSDVNNGRRQPSRNINEREEKWVITREIIEKLKEIQLKYFRLATSPYDYTSYEALIENQKNLIDFRVRWTIAKHYDPPTQNQHQLENQRPIGISWTLYKTPILASASTLTCVDLKGITLPVTPNHFEVALDASIFNNAQSLRRLVLHRSPDDLRRSIGQHDLPSMINILNIPNSIQELEILRFRLLSSDLQVLVDSLNNLTNITLSRTGGHPDLGVHGGIITSIMESSIIKTMSITCINWSKKEENVKYEAMKNKYKFSLSSEEHLYYDFERYRKGEEQQKYQISPRPCTVTTTTTYTFVDNSQFPISEPNIFAGPGPNKISIRSSGRGNPFHFMSKGNRKLPHRKLREWVRTSGLYSDSLKNSSAGLSTLLNSDQALPQFVNYNHQEQHLQQNGSCSINVNNEIGAGPSSKITDNTTATQATASTSTSALASPSTSSFTIVESDQSTSKQTPTIIYRNGRYFIADDGSGSDSGDSTTSDDSESEEVEVEV